MANSALTGFGAPAATGLTNAAAVAITGGSITGITDLAVADGGTGSSTAATARAALGVTLAGLGPQTLADGATIAVDATLGNLFRVTLGGNRTLGNPTGALDGQLLLFELKQDGTGNRTITLDTKYLFGTDITSITLTITASKTDYLLVVYNSSADKFRVLDFVKGF